MDFDTVYLLVLSFKPVGFFRFTPNRRYLLMACVRVSQAMDIKKHKNVCVYMFYELPSCASVVSFFCLRIQVLILHTYGTDRNHSSVHHGHHMTRPRTGGHPLYHEDPGVG